MDTQKPIISSKEVIDAAKSDEILDDFKFSRDNYYDLINSGTEAITAMLDLAKESEHPRAFEVLGKLIKDVADVNEKLLKLQKNSKELSTTQSNSGGATGTTNNNLFVGSTTELQKMLSGASEKIINNDEQ